MESYQEIELQECPICGGAGLMEEENGWCFYVACLDCGSHTAEIRYERPAERLDAAQRAAHLWNIGKVLTDTPNESIRFQMSCRGCFSTAFPGCGWYNPA